MARDRVKVPSEQPDGPPRPSRLLIVLPVCLLIRRAAGGQMPTGQAMTGSNDEQEQLLNQLLGELDVVDPRRGA